MAGGGKPGGAAAASKPGGFLKKVKEEKAKEEVQEKAAKAETKKEPFKKEVSKEEPKKFSAGDSLIPERRGLSYSGRRSPALSGRRSPMSRAEARKYSTPDPRVVITFVWFVLCCVVDRHLTLHYLNGSTAGLSRPSFLPPFFSG